MLDFIERNEAWLTFASELQGTKQAWRCAVGDRQQENKLLRTEVERLKDFELNYETLTRLLHNRFKMKDGIMPDYKVEDVLVENNQLRAALAAAQQDKERIDWMEANWPKHEVVIYPMSEHVLWVDEVAYRGIDLRAAIDAARSQLPESGRDQP